MMKYLDMLAKMGIGNAHPGGFAATLKQLKQYPIPHQAKIIEVGCGTGRTACYLAGQGYNVTGIDLRPDMLIKAKLRAEKEQVSVQFTEGDASALAYADESFDVVLVESVTVFTDSAKALSEYYRVLRRGGQLFDREMVQRKSMTDQIYNEIINFFQVKQIWNLETWTDSLTKTGFNKLHIDGPHMLPEIDEDLLHHPDHHQHIDDGSFTDMKIWEIKSRYNEIMERYREYIGYILAIGYKS